MPASGECRGGGFEGGGVTVEDLASIKRKNAFCITMELNSVRTGDRGVEFSVDLDDELLGIFLTISPVGERTRKVNSFAIFMKVRSWRSRQGIELIHPLPDVIKAEGYPFTILGMQGAPGEV